MTDLGPVARYEKAEAEVAWLRDMLSQAHFHATRPSLSMDAAERLRRVTTLLAYTLETEAP